MTSEAPTGWHKSVCPYCGVGCGVDIGVRNDRVVAVRGTKEHPVNRGDLCALGNNLVDILETEDRLHYPMHRVAGELRRASWPAATQEVAARLGAILERSGPDAFAMYVSASEYIEEYYVYNKFVKGCIGTNNLESSARLCWASGVAGLVRAFGADCPPCAYDDIEQADLFIISGYNPAWSKPVFFRRLLRAKERGASMIAVDPRVTETSRRADLHLRLKPGTDVALHNGIAHVLLERGLIDPAEAATITSNSEDFARHVSRFTPELAAGITGLEPRQLVQAAEMIGRASAALFSWGQGLNQSSIGTRKVATFLNLAFITGNLGRPGAGPLAVTGQSNAMGLREVGALPHLLPGFRAVGDASAREAIAEIWGVDAKRLSPTPGKTLPAILESIERGELEALWVIHANPAATFPDSSWVRSVLAKLKLLVVQDCYHPTETTQLADVLLPAAQWAEKPGTVTNSERGLNLVEQAVEPPGEARADLDIVCDVAHKLGFGEHFDYADTEAIFEEFKGCTSGRPNDIRGVDYARLRREPGIQWPVATASDPGTKRRFVDRCFPAGRLQLGIFQHSDAKELPDDDYPYLLITGVTVAQFHSRTRTSKVPSLQQAAPEPLVDIHPRDASRAGLDDGDWVELESRRGRVRARARLSDTICEGSVFIPYHFGQLAGADCAINSLTHRAFDEFGGQPEYKACAVRVTRL